MKIVYNMFSFCSGKVNRTNNRTLVKVFDLVKQYAEYEVTKILQETINKKLSE